MGLEKQSTIIGWDNCHAVVVKEKKEHLGLSGQYIHCGCLEAKAFLAT